MTCDAKPRNFASSSLSLIGLSGVPLEQMTVVEQPGSVFQPDRDLARFVSGKVGRYFGVYHEFHLAGKGKNLFVPDPLFFESLHP